MLELLSIVVYTIINSNGVVGHVCPMASRVSAVSQEERRPPKERFCPHCNEYVSKATFFRHRLFYYDHLAKLRLLLTIVIPSEDVSAVQYGSLTGVSFMF